MNLSRCRSCRTIVKLTVKQANETQACCDNPLYVKVKPIHLMHKDANGEVYSNGIKTGGFMAKLLELEGQTPNPLRLACPAPARKAGTAAVTMPQAVTCPDCLEWLRNSKLPTPEPTIPEPSTLTELDQPVPTEDHSLSEVKELV